MIVDIILITSDNVYVEYTYISLYTYIYIYICWNSYHRR